jgi:RNA polymerase sigma factor (sigma-70 family)
MSPTTFTAPARPPTAPSDDELARTAHEEGLGSDALQALYERIAAAMRGFVARHVAHHALPAVEAEDARQELALAFLQAASRYDPNAGEPFHAFLHRVLRDGLSKYERGLRRAERRVDRSRPVDALALPATDADPAALAIEEEECLRLEAALARLDDEDRRLWRALTDDGKLHTAAEEMGRSCDSIKRQRRRLLAWLRKSLLGDGSAGPPPPARRRRPPTMIDDTDAAFHLASELLGSGRRREAEEALRALAAADPGCAPALQTLGRMAYEAGRAADAVDWFGRALGAEPTSAFSHSCLGAALQAAGRFDEAEAAHRRALALKPGDALAFNNLAITLAALGKHREAEAALREALTADPGDAAAWCNLGPVLLAQGRGAEAEAACREALRFAPGLAPAHTNLGNALQNQGRFAEAEASYRKALELQPGLPQAQRNLAGLLLRRGRCAEAARGFGEALRWAPHDAKLRVGLAECLLALNRAPEAAALSREALRIDPQDADAANGLGNALAALGRLDEAEAAYREAARLRPRWSVPVYNLGVALQGQGRLGEARACFVEALRLNPADPVAHSTYVGSLLFDPEIDGEWLLAESRRWAERHAPAPASTPFHSNAPDPDRRLRVGYVSPDFRSHAVAFFLGPVLAQHDADAVEVFCYADVAAPDETTARLRALGHNWRPTWGLCDDEMEALVRQDGVDVLVDLGGHLANNRLRLFARRPAPVQLSWLGYPASTGLDAISYRLTDAVCDPPDDALAAGERLARLPGPFCCYGPPLDVPLRIDLPSEEKGSVVFGSLHKLEKLNDGVLDLWTQILLEVPDARLLLCRNTLQGATADLWRERFAQRGLAPQRVELRHVAPVGLQHLRVYDGVDAALDCFPWSGHTTACEALWMGVPVVTLRGRTCAGRMAASVLEAVGLKELVAETPDDYRRIAAGLAQDAAYRKELRQTLRLRMLRSPLCDKTAFTRGLEDAYRAAWREWCAPRESSLSETAHDA